MKYKECGFLKAEKMPRQVFVGLTVREGMRGGLWPTCECVNESGPRLAFSFPHLSNSLYSFFNFLMGGKGHFLNLLQLCGVKTATKDGVAQSCDGIG